VARKLGIFHSHPNFRGRGAHIYIITSRSLARISESTMVEV